MYLMALFRRMRARATGFISDRRKPGELHALPPQLSGISSASALKRRDLFQLKRRSLFQTEVEPLTLHAPCACAPANFYVNGGHNQTCHNRTRDAANFYVNGGHNRPSDRDTAHFDMIYDCGRNKECHNPEPAPMKRLRRE
jgi:hypothetical protein